MVNKNQKMKIILIILVVILCSISSISYIFKSSDSPEKKEDEVENATEVENAVEDLESIKDRIKKTEKYREYYRSETNNGITVVGTLMEQMIDVMIAVLKQPLVKEVVSKHVTEKQDAIDIAEYIEMLGKEIVKEVKQTPLLRCGRKMVETCETEVLDSGEELKKCLMVEGDGDAPVNNCDYYVTNHKEIEKGIDRATVNLYNKTLSIIEKSEERDKIYRISKNLANANKKQYMLSSGIEIDDKYINNNYPEQSYMENVAMAHYKYLGKELSTTLGESVNVRELTEDEKPYISYMMRSQNPSEDDRDDRLIITSSVPPPPPDETSQNVSSSNDMTVVDTSIDVGSDI